MEVTVTKKPEGPDPVLPQSAARRDDDARVRERLRFLLWARSLRNLDRQTAPPHAS